MLKILNDIKSKIPRPITDFICIKSQEVLIPYMEIGIECLVRNISELNLFFETILKLIEIEVKNISEISTILGVSFEVAKEAVVDMVSYDYINVSESTLRITKKGIEALRTKKLIEIKKNNLNNIMVNLITGEITDGENIKTAKVNKSSVCLMEEVKINKQFLDTSFQGINQVFQIQQETNSIFGIGSTKELYKIVTLHYQKLKYIKNHVFLYKSKDSDELQFKFDSDTNNRYLDSLYKQLQSQINPCLENFFERDKDFIIKQKTRTFIVDEVLYSAANDLRIELSCKDNIKVIKPELLEKRRYALIDLEYMSYLYFSNELKFECLYIRTNRINSVLSSSLFSEIIRISDKTPVFILYDKSEFHAAETIDYFLGKKVNKNLSIIPCETINETVICFESSLLIEIQEYTIDALGNTISYKMPIIDFDKRKTKEWSENIKKQYAINEDLKS